MERLRKGDYTRFRRGFSRLEASLSLIVRLRVAHGCTFPYQHEKTVCSEPEKILLLRLSRTCNILQHGPAEDYDLQTAHMRGKAGTHQHGPVIFRYPVSVRKDAAVSRFPVDCVLTFL